MKILEANLDDVNEVKTIIDLIYQVFLECNAMQSTEGLVRKMELQYGPGYDYDSTLAILKKSPLFFVAKEGHQIVGIIRGTLDKIINLYICNDYHGKGIGKQLLRKFEDKAKFLGSTVIGLKSSNYALNFYLKNGYIVVHDSLLTKQLT